MRRPVCQVCRLGRIDYGKAWDLQKRLAEARAGEEISDTLLLLEHPPTYTLGKRGNESNLLVSRRRLLEEGVGVYHVDRGGDITYHGPGQLVGYPVLNLNGHSGGPSRYLRDIEEALIRGLSAFGIEAGRLPGFTGVWVGDEKIAAIGVKINAKRITQHGFALNVTTDTHYFRQIVPCGIRDKGVTTLGNLLGRPVTLDEAADPMVEAFGTVFHREMIEVDPGRVLCFLEEHDG